MCKKWVDIRSVSRYTVHTLNWRRLINGGANDIRTNSNHSNNNVV